MGLEITAQDSASIKLERRSITVQGRSPELFICEVVHPQFPKFTQKYQYFDGTQRYQKYKILQRVGWTQDYQNLTFCKSATHKYWDYLSILFTYRDQNMAITSIILPIIIGWTLRS